MKDTQRRQLRIQWPTRQPVADVKLNGKAIDSKLVPAVNRALVEISVKADQPLKLEMAFAGEPLGLTAVPENVVQGQRVELKVRGGKLAEFDDPQGCLAKYELASDDMAAGIVPRGEGFHTFFVKLISGNLTYWAPVSFIVGPAWQIVEEFEAADPPRTAPIKQLWPKLDAPARKLMVRVRNRQSEAMVGPLKLSAGGESISTDVNIAPGQPTQLELALSPEAWGKLLPGQIAFAVEGFGIEQRGKVYSWPVKEQPGAPRLPAVERLLAVDFNASRNLTERAMEQVPMPLDFGSMDKLLGWYNTSFDMDPLPTRFEPLAGLPFVLSPGGGDDLGDSACGNPYDCRGSVPVS